MTIDIHAVWNILVNLCGAPEHLKSDFLYRMKEHGERGTASGSLEFRFCGRLGFGGKVYITDRGVRVSCYPEDESVERRDVIVKANQELAKLVKEARV